MYPAADNAAALADISQRFGYERADRGENECSVKFTWCRFVRTAGPFGPEFAREALRAFITGTGEGVDFLSGMTRDLGDDMCGRSEPVNADAFGMPREAQAAKADQSGT